MTSHSLPPLQLARPRRWRRARPQWRRAWRALRRLLNDPDRTQEAYEVVYALDPGFGERGLAQLLEQPEGRRLFVERPSLLPVLCDRERLARLPAGSLGCAYLEHVERYGLDPGKLVELRRKADPGAQTEDPGLRWYLDRSGLVHDLFHVLAGYGADARGEAALLYFSLGQLFGLGTLFLAAGAGIRAWSGSGIDWPLYLFRAWRRGRNALPLAALPYEEWLGFPLGEVRRAVAIEPPDRAHRGGVRRDPHPAAA